MHTPSFVVRLLPNAGDMSNESKMTLEERIVQNIKSDTLMTLVGDEDAILELTRRAVSEALYQPRRVKKDWGGWDDKDSPVTEAAREVAKKAIEKIAEAEIERLTSDPAVIQQVRECLAVAFPDAMGSRMYAFVDAAIQRTKMETFGAVQEAIRNGIIPTR
jgi:hypothetical protein